MGDPPQRLGGDYPFVGDRDRPSGASPSRSASSDPPVVASERNGMGDNKRKLLLTLLIVGVLGSVAAIGTYSAFVATATNTGNSFSAGTVEISDASGLSTALFNNVTNQAPGH